MRPRVLLADDHSLLLDAFEKLLAPQCDVVGKVGDGRALLAAIERLAPHVVVLDIAMPQLNGLEAAREIVRTQPAVKLIFLTMNEDPDLMAEAFRLGASAYLFKRSAASELSAAIKAVARGESYVTPLVTEAPPARPPQADDQKARELSPRQREVLRLLAEGHSMKAVAAALNLTPRTVAFHKYRMMEQLKIKSTAELIHYAVKNSIV
jgi:DNA-binding NarL/FixJ family response regulator